MNMTRAPRIVTVCVHGTIARQRDTPERLALLQEVIDAALSYPDWPPIDAILFPGGFFRLKERLGHGDSAVSVGYPRPSALDGAPDRHGQASRSSMPRFDDSLG
jgi:hypothetical protein